MRNIRPLLLCAILLFSAIPFSQVNAESTEVCCDSGPVELFLIGPAGSGSMTPFSATLIDSSEEVKITDAIAQQREIGTWSINPAWTGSYPSSTWEFSIDYEIANAGGAQINATVEVEVGGETHTGSTDQSNSFLPSGSGSLSIDVNVDSGAISSSSPIRVTLVAQTVVFSVPGTDAGLTFMWGGSDDESSIMADIPLVDMIVEEPVIEGMDVHISVVIASPFGTLTAAHANLIEIRVGSELLSGDPISTSSGEYVRMTWTWRASDSGEQQITITTSIQIQSGTPTLSGSADFTISTFDSGDNGGGVFYPTEEPLRSDGVGAPLSVALRMEMDVDEDYITMSRTITLHVDEEIAYWMRWGMDNIGNDDPGISQPLRIFKSGAISDEDRRNRVVDEVEISEFENQMVNLGVTYMNDGMALELEELIGSSVIELTRISFELDTLGENRVTPHPLKLTIRTFEVMENGVSTDLLSTFIQIQPTPIWSNLDINIDISTSMMSSLTGATVKGENGLKLEHRRTPFGETITITGTNLDADSTFTIQAFPTTNPLNAPLTLSLITLALIGAGFFFSLIMTKNKRRNAIWIETILAPVVLGALYLAYQPMTVGIIAGITVVMWWLTAIASPKKKGVAKPNAATTQFPIIDCPSCSIPNPITSNARPFRTPCIGCGKVLKIVE